MQIDKPSLVPRAFAIPAPIRFAAPVTIADLFMGFTISN